MQSPSVRVACVLALAAPFLAAAARPVPALQPGETRPVDRLRVETRIPGEKQVFRPGEKVPLAAVIHNPTDQSIRFTYPAGWWIHAPLVVARGEDKILVRGSRLAAAPTRHYSREVPPGGTVVMRHEGLRLGRPGTDPPVKLVFADPRPGEYLVKILKPWRPETDPRANAAAFRVVPQ